MAIETHYRNGDILVRHLRRHSRVSILFRSLEPGSAGSLPRRASLGIPPIYSSGQIIPARLALFKPDLPWGDSIPAGTTPVIERETLPQQAEPVQFAEAPGTLEAPMPASFESQPPGEEPLLQGPGEPAAAEAAPDLDHLAWRRLESIYHSQQEQAQEAAGVSAAHPPAPEPVPVARRQAYPSGQPGSQVAPGQGKAAALQASPQPAPVQLSRQPEIRPAPPAEPSEDIRSSSKITDADWKRLKKISRLHEEKEQRERAAAAHQIQKSPETQPPSSVKPAAPPPPAVSDASRLIQERPGSIREAGTIAGKPPAPRIVELPALEEKSQPAEPSTAPQAVEAQPSRVQRAWRQLQNIFGWQAENDAHEPGGIPQPEAMLRPAPVEGDQTGPAYVPEITTEEGTPEQEASYPATGPASHAEELSDAARPEGPAESQAAPVPGPIARQVQPAVRPGEPAEPSAVQDQVTVIQTQRAIDQEPSPATSRIPATAAFHPQVAQSLTAPIPLEELESPLETPETGIGGAPVEEFQPQSLPLEQVWPVERLERPGPQVVQKAELSPAAGPVPPVELPAEEAQEVHRLMQKAQPGQPTDSMLEVIPPRRPRPPVQPVSEAGEQVETPIEGKPAAAEAQTVQLSPVKRPPAPLAAPVDHIPAGLNPELAQLWGMLDEVQSNQRESTPTPIAEEEAPDTNKGSREARAAIQRVELPGEQVVRPAQIESQPIPQPADATVSAAAPEASLIQRQQAPATGTGGPAAEANQPSGQPGKLDIDELARQVYAEVKRRLALEWERMRR